MIPPVPSATLKGNPQFAALHKKLTTDFLDHDASSRKLNASHAPIESHLNNRHIQQAKDDILTRSIHSLCGESSLPPELLELIYTISIYITAASELDLSKTETDILSPTISNFEDNLSAITPALTSIIREQYSSLLDITQLAFTSIPSSSSPLTTALTPQLTHLATLRHTTIPSVTTTLLNTLTTLLSTLTTHLTLLITILERSTHGTLCRYTLAHSTHLSTISSTLALKTRILALDARKATYTPGIQDALSSYARHLEVLGRRLDLRIQECEEELRLYRECDGQGGETIMEVARRYRDVLLEIDEVKADIERLETDRMPREGR